jgi:hypothetical protein
MFIKPRKERYKEISEKEFIPILAEYDPNLETLGLDEANLDVTDYLIDHNLNTPEGRI